jgi:hypothetical protein
VQKKFQIEDFSVEPDWLLSISNFAFSKSSLRVAGEVALDAFRQETLSAALTTARERRASAFGPHPRAKTVLLFARSF